MNLVLLVPLVLLCQEERPRTNAPVAPDAVYVGRAGAVASLSVVDLNGFGAGTGSPAYDPACPIGPGQTNFPNDPNVSLQGILLVPPLIPGTTTFDGGSAGVFRLTRNAGLEDRLLAGSLGSVDDLALGHSLDRIFGAFDPGCPAFNLCASTGLKLFEPVLGPGDTLRPALAGETPLVSISGGENPISWAPHPNPPPAAAFPGCSGVHTLEPTSVDTQVLNLLAPGPSPFGFPGLCIPPTNLLAAEQNVFFQGPSLPQASVTACSPFAYRQQVGHVLYVADRAAGAVLAVHSNHAVVLDRIPLPDPARLAMSPNLTFLAVTNPAADTVSFVDVDPLSATFHQVVKTTAVGDAPFGVAWESGDEDVLVACEGDGSLHVISALTLDVRKVVTGFLDEPFEVVTTPRQQGFGLDRGVYYAWILGRGGELALFESGPAGDGGIGYDDVIGTAPFRLASPTALQPDPRALVGAVWVTHEDPLDPATGAPSGAGGPAATRVSLDAVVHAPQTLVPGSAPNLRDLSFVIDASLDSNVLTGTPSDLAFDDQRNLGSLPNLASPYGAGPPIAMNGKSLVKKVPGSGRYLPVSSPRFLFLAVPSSSEGPGVVDVVDLETLTRVDADVFQPGVQSIAARGARTVAHYFRQ